jgi:uncharacterized membrane protein YdcZ (DUF606 family)
MNWFVWLPLLAGAAGVLQGGLNKRLAPEWGLAWVLVITSIIVLVLSGVLLLTNAYPGKLSWSDMKWWHALPGFLGFAVILCIPISIEKLGALPSFLMVLASQIVVSGLWDRFAEGVALSGPRLIGAALAILGAWLATK